MAKKPARKPTVVKVDSEDLYLQLDLLRLAQSGLPNEATQTILARAELYRKWLTRPV